jgi:transcriptional regulator with GAF, ATPase, and Fis domain
MLSGTDNPSGSVGDDIPKELDLLHKISESVCAVETSRERFLRVMQILDETFGRRYGTLTLLSPGEGRTLLDVTFGDPSSPQGRIQGLNRSIIKEVLAKARPLAISRTAQKPITCPARTLHEKETALLCLPVMNNVQPVGVMGTNPIYTDTVSFEGDIRLLSVIVCLAFQNAPLPGDDYVHNEGLRADPPLDTILEDKLRRIIDKVDPRTESRCALLPDILRLVEKIAIKWALRRHQNVQTSAASFLGINRNTLRRKMKDLNIHPQ